MRTIYELAAAIDANASDFWDGRINYETFDRRARSLWGEVGNRANAVRPLLLINQRN